MTESINTTEELDALPEGSAVLDNEGDVWQLRDDEWHCAAPEVSWVKGWELPKFFGPLTVMHRPDAVPQAPEPSEDERERLAERAFYAAGRDDWGVANELERDEWLDVADATLADRDPRTPAPAAPATVEAAARVVDRVLYTTDHPGMSRDEASVYEDTREEAVQDIPPALADAGLLRGVVTDAMVQRAAEALAGWDGADGFGTDHWNGEITQRAYVRGARLAVTAALGAGS